MARRRFGVGRLVRLAGGGGRLAPPWAVLFLFDAGQLIITASPPHTASPLLTPSHILHPLTPSYALSRPLTLAPYHAHSHPLKSRLLSHPLSLTHAPSHPAAQPSFSSHTPPRPPTPSPFSSHTRSHHLAPSRTLSHPPPAPSYALPHPFTPSHALSRRRRSSRGAARGARALRRQTRRLPIHARQVGRPVVEQILQSRIATMRRGLFSRVFGGVRLLLHSVFCRQLDLQVSFFVL